MKKPVKLIGPALLLCMCLSSCFVSRVDVGSNGNKFATTQDKATIIYSKTKNVYLFWGLLPISNQQPPTPPGCNYTVETRTDLFDVLLFALTDGIFGMQTVKILVKSK